MIRQMKKNKNECRSSGRQHIPPPGAQSHGFCLNEYLRLELVPQLPLDIPTETPRSPEMMAAATLSLYLPTPCETLPPREETLPLLSFFSQRGQVQPPDSLW